MAEASHVYLERNAKTTKDSKLYVNVMPAWGKLGLSAGL